jgi:hypothetical protein
MKRHFVPAARSGTYPLSFFENPQERALAAPVSAETASKEG